MKIYEKGDLDYQDLITTMQDNLDKQHEPKVGIFWYNPETNKLFDISKINAGDILFNSKGRKTISTLHRTVWKENEEKSIENGEMDSIYFRDYTQMPRGRVFQYENGRFEIVVGSWIDKYPNLHKTILKEFDLTHDITDIVIGEHWEIGRGWSE